MPDDDDVRRVLTTVASLAAELGPALAPRGFNELLESIAEMARTTLGAAACYLVLVEGDELVFRVAAGAGAEAVVGDRMPIGQGIAGWVVASGQALGIEDVSQDPRFAPESALAGGYAPQAMYAIPLDVGEDVVGVLEVFDPAAEHANRALALLEPFARQAALAVKTGEAFDHLGQVLFQAAAAAVESADGQAGDVGDADVAAALREIAADAPPAQAALAQIAADLAAVSRLDAADRAGASAVLRAFIAYVNSREQ